MFCTDLRRPNMTETMDSHIRSAPQRGALYKYLAETLAYPSQTLYSRWREGELQQQISGLLGKIPYPLDSVVAQCKVPNFTELASEYMRLFELPVDGQPCPLYGGVYASSRREVMEELLRYYHFFGLTTQGAADGDLPDSIPTLLEFLQFLAFRESLCDDMTQTLAARAAQKDLLERHLTRWVPVIASQLQQRNPLSFYADTVDLLNKFTAGELQALTD